MRPRASRAAAKASSVSAKHGERAVTAQCLDEAGFGYCGDEGLEGAGADGDVDNGAGTFFLFGPSSVLVVAWLGGVGGLDGIVGFFDGIIVAAGSGNERNRRGATRGGVAGNAWGIFLVQGKGEVMRTGGLHPCCSLNEGRHAPRMHSGCEVDAVCVDLMSAAFRFSPSAGARPP